MENENKKSQIPQEDKWLDEILGKPVPPAELGPDEMAVTAAGLVHMDDMDLEKIMAEDWSKVPDLDGLDPAAPREEPPAEEPAPQETPAENADATQMFFPLEETNASEQEPAPVTDERTAMLPKMKAPKTPKVPKEKKENTVSDGEKTRPKRKKGYGLLGIPHILSTVIWLVIIVAIGVTLGNTLWVCCADLMAFGKENREVVITITEEDDIDSIAQKLADNGLIEYPVVFKYFATLTGKDEDIDVGTFTLNAIYDYNAMINNMIDYGPAREEIEIMIPEGYTCAQIFALMEEKGVCTAAELEAYAAEGELSNYWFLEGVQRGDKYCLEGYLFPDTYRFYTNDEPRHVLEKFLDGFDYRFTDVMKKKLDPLNQELASVLSSRGYGQSYIDEHKITIREVVIIASMLEKETSNDDESYTISSVIYNRLTNPANFVYLNIDATIIYALNGNIDPETGKVKPLTQEDYQIDSPYNTYTEPGLPPGPISNPGRNSLDAALDPEDTGYYYYVLNPETGKHIFAKTLREHENNIDYVNSLG